MQYTKPLANLIDFFQRLPGIGPKSAQRIAFHLLKMPINDVQKFAQAMVTAKETIHYCDVCFNMSATNPCEICSSTNRDDSVICVCAETKDLVAIENTNEYKGKYHVLQGLISPIDGIGAEDIRIKELLQRVSKYNTKEVIMATNPDVPGDTTAYYIAELLKPLGVKVTRIAQGVSMGTDLEYADEVTLNRAIELRNALN